MPDGISFSELQELCEAGDFLPPQMIDDLENVAGIPDAAIDRIATELQAASSILDPKQVNSLLTEVVANEGLASALARTLQNIPPDEVSGTLEILSRWRSRHPDNAKRVSDDAFQSLKVKLPRLVRSYPAIERYRKARRLATRIGPVVQRIELICDCRPVFDEARTHVEAMTPLTTLRIIYDDETETGRAFEVLLPTAELEDLISKATQAQRKLTVLRESIQQWIPDGLADVL